eukprot:m.170070 g.170070  ORF g.170070 m.170070 type:complete len:223 (+) comp14517_c1_seq2:685-1353(+)
MWFAITVWSLVLAWLLCTSALPVALSFTLYGLLSHFGLFPRPFISFYARAIRLPRELRLRLKGKYPFEYNVVVPGKLLIGRIPPTIEQYKRLTQTEGVNAVVDLTQPWEQHVSPKTIADLGVERVNFPTPDFNTPTLQDMIDAVNFIEAKNKEGKTVYVHCNGGKGRAAAVVCAWRMKVESRTPKQALDLLRTVRKVTKLNKFGGVLPAWRRLNEYSAFIKN